MNTSIEQVQHQIEGYETQIQQEARRMEKHTQAKREETQRKLEQARQAVSDADERLKQLAAEFRELEQANKDLYSSGKEDEARVNELRANIQRCQEIIEQCKQKENDKYIPYGKNIKMLLDKIKMMQWHGEVPLGPLGTYVGAKDPGKWGTILRYHLGQFLTAFAVTDARDRPIMKKLLNDSGKYVSCICPRVLA